MIRTAVIGLGDISPVHIQALNNLPGVQLAAGCDLDPGRRGKLPPSAAFYTNYKELLEKEPLEAVHICLPHYLHYPVAAYAAQRGKHVLCEKPLAMNGREAEDFAALGKEHGIRLGVCLQNRYNPTSQALLRLLRSGEYGEVAGLRGTVCWRRDGAYYASSPWRGRMAEAGGGCMMNQAIHTLDLLQYFAGSPVQTVKGCIGQVLDLGLEVEDTATGHIRFLNGAEGLFSATVANFRDSNVELEVRCEKASFLLRDRSLYQIGENGELEVLADDGGQFAGKQVYGNSHAQLIEAFYTALETGGEDYLKASEGVASVKLIEAIRRSSESGKSIDM